MSSFLYEIGKKELETEIEIRTYFTTKNKKTQITKNAIPYVLYLKKEDFEKLKLKNDKILLAEKEFRNKNNEKVVCLHFKDKDLLEIVAKQAREAEFELFEADLLAEHRYLIDNDIALHTGKEYYKPKYISVDIETIGEVKDQTITLISSHSFDDENYNRVYVNKASLNKKGLEVIKSTKFEDFNLIILEDEKRLLEQFQEDIIEFNPQIILGWNVVDFDFFMIKKKMEVHGIPFKFSSYDGQTKLRILNDFFQTSTMTAPGVLVYDVIALLKTNFIDFEDYKLNTVARAVLKDSKIELENDEQADVSMENKINAIQHMYENDLKTLIEYNFKDSLLTSQIFEKLNLMDLMCQRSITTGTPLYKVKSPIATLDIMYLKELHKRGYVADTNYNFRDTTPIEGAFVIDPQKGFYNDVFVLDFKSLYPSIIMTFNIDPFTYTKKGPIEAPNGAYFVKEPGILPDLIRQLMQEREKAKQEKDHIKSHAIKITMNSFYGAVASPKSRFYNKDVGEAITAFGRDIIQRTKQFIEEKGYVAVYGDTDSIFVQGKGPFKTLEEKKKQGKELESEINAFFNNWVRQEFGQQSFLTIEFEKLFSSFFIATKKRYVGYDEFTKKNVFVGMEAIRGDWTELAKEFQRRLIDLIFSGSKEEEIKTFIKDYVKELEKGDLDGNLVYTKRITKPLAQYTKTTPPHVKAARELKEFQGRIVKYIMTSEGPKHITLITDNTKYDYDHYVNKQLKGVSDDILDSLGIDFDEVISSKKQKSLNKFF